MGPSFTLSVRLIEGVRLIGGSLNRGFTVIIIIHIVYTFSIHFLRYDEENLFDQLLNPLNPKSD